MIIAIRHFCIEVLDLDAAVKFYVSIGLQPVYHSLENWSVDGKFDRRHIVKLRAAGGGSLLEIIERGLYEDGFEHPYRHTHIAFQCEAIEMTCKELEEKGCQVVTPLGFSPDKSAKVAFYKDPFGVTIEIVEINHEKRGSDSGASGQQTDTEQKS